MATEKESGVSSQLGILAQYDREEFGQFAHNYPFYKRGNRSRISQGESSAGLTPAQIV